MVELRSILAMIWFVVSIGLWMYLQPSPFSDRQTVDVSMIEEDIQQKVQQRQRIRLLEHLNVDALLPLPDTRIHTVEDACAKAEYFFSVLESVQLEACNLEERQNIVGDNCSAHSLAFQSCIDLEQMQYWAESYSGVASLYLHIQFLEKAAVE